MKAGNISPAAELAQAVAGVKPQGNVGSSAEGNLASFQMYLAANSGKAAETEIVPAASQGGVKAVDDSRSKDFANLRENSVKDKISESDRPVNGAEAGNSAEGAVSEAENRIKEAVKKELGLTDEELEAALANLGFTVADLIVPQNAAALVAEVNGTDVMAVVADGELTGQLTGLMTAIDAVVSEVSEQFEIKPEQLAQAIEQSAGAEETGPEEEAADTGAKAGNEVPAEQTEYAVVKDESTGREIRVEVTDSRETGSSTEVQYAKTPENAGTAQDNTKDGTQDKRQEGSQSRNEHGFAENLVQNLSRTVMERTGGVQSFAESYTVNTADVVHQIIEAIRVNVNAVTTSMEVQLNPEHLGKISLNVATRDGVVTATITAQNEAVKGAIESQIVQLRDSLNEQGLKVQSVEVAVSNHGFDLGENTPGQEQNSRQGANRGRHFRNPDSLSEDEAGMPETLEQTLMEANGSSVSYTA